VFSFCFPPVGRLLRRFLNIKWGNEVMRLPISESDIPYLKATVEFPDCVIPFLENMSLYYKHIGKYTYKLTVKFQNNVGEVLYAEKMLRTQAEQDMKRKQQLLH
jgi:hypothetical protein